MIVYFNYWLKREFWREVEGRECDFIGGV